MAAGQDEAVGERVAVDFDLQRVACGVGLDIEEPGVGACARAEAHDAGEPAGVRGGGQAVELRVVAVEHRGAVGAHAREDFGLGIGDLLDRGEGGQMDRLDGRDQRDVGSDQLGQRRQLAGMVHARLEDAEGGVRRQPGQAQRHADMVVQAARAGVGRAARSEREMEHFLAARLAHAAGHRGNSGPAPVARLAAEGFESHVGVGDAQAGGGVGELFGPALDHDRDGASLTGTGGKRVTVEFRSLERDEEVAGGQCAAVDGNARCAPLAAGKAAGGACRVGGGPERGAGHERDPPRRRTALRATSASSNGIISLPTIWPVLVALAGEQRDVSGTQARDGLANGLAPLGDLERVGTGLEDGGADRRRCFGARIVVGDDDGIGELGGGRAHQGALARIAVAAAAEQHHEAPLGVGTQRAEHGGQGVGGVGVVDEHRGAVRASRDELQSAGRAPQSGQRIERRGRGHAGGDGEAQRGEQVERLEAAREAALHLVAGPLEGEGELLARFERPGGAQPDVGVALAIGDEAVAAPPADLGQGVELGHVGREHGNAALGHDRIEQALLGRQVARGIGVIIEMLAAQVGEGGGAQAHAVEPALIEAVGRGPPWPDGRRRDRPVRSAPGATPPDRAWCGGAGWNSPPR